LQQRRKARPVVYIDQPDFSMPHASMQGEYHSSHEDNTVSAPKKQRPIRLPQVKREQPAIIVESELDEPDIVVEEVDEVNNEMDDENIVEESDDTNEIKQSTVKKPFTKMTLAERIDYLVAPSLYTPRMKCEVVTKEERYRGKIVDIDGEQIKFETFKHPKFH